MRVVPYPEEENTATASIRVCAWVPIETSFYNSATAPAAAAAIAELTNAKLPSTDRGAAPVARPPAACTAPPRKEGPHFVLIASYNAGSPPKSALFPLPGP